MGDTYKGKLLRLTLRTNVHRKRKCPWMLSGISLEGQALDQVSL